MKRPYKLIKRSGGGPHGSAARKRTGALAGLTMVAVMVAVSFGMTPALAAEWQVELEKLEERFFHHTYPKDSNDARIDRLEKMVYGEAKDGSEKERMASLLKLIPDDDDTPQTASGSGKTGGASGGASSGSGSSGSSSGRTASNDAPKDGSESDYPAVSAIERKYFGKDFSHEPVEERLARLEKKAFGKVSTSNDLVDRMDNLKEASGVDVARRPSSPGADWQDEDDDIDYPAPSDPVSRRVPGVSPKYGDDQTSFSGRNIAQDLNRAFGRTPGRSYSGGSGSYGMSGMGSSGSSASSGSYGFGSGGTYGLGGRVPGRTYPGGSIANGGSFGSGGGIGAGSSLAYTPRTAPPSVDPDDDDDDDLSDMPPVAPRRTMGGAAGGGVPATGSGPAGMVPGGAGGAASGGLTGQLDALEQQVFGKQFPGSLNERLDRLENVVFPNVKNLKNMTPPARIANLNRVIPQSSPIAQQQQQMDPNYDPNNDPLNGQDPSRIAQQPKRGGFSKIINSLGNFLGGGMMVGSYATGGNLITDPTTGNLIDQTSGNIIDPHTGMVLGRRAGIGTPMVQPYSGFNSFNNGFSPYYSPYSSPYGNPMYSNPMYGIGGSGIRFGSGFGGLRFGGGMWP